MISSPTDCGQPAAVPVSGRQGRLRRAFERIFGRQLLYCVLLVCFAVGIAGAIGHPTELIQDPDVWWHLADARMLFATHYFIHADPYSFTVAGERWVNPEWLAEVPYWLGYKAEGLSGVHLVAVAVFCANLLFIYFRSYWKARHQTAAFWTAVLGVFLIAINFGARTIGVAYLALSAEMAILEAAERGRTKLLWLLPPLFCVWINLHGSWIIGLVFLGLYIAGGIVKVNAGIFHQDAFSPRDRKRLLLVFAASAAALMLNPYGWRLIWNPLDMMLHQKLMLRMTDEWQPLKLGSTAGMAAVACIALMIAANIYRPRKWKLYEMAFMLLAWYMAFAHQRFAFLACVITMPWLAADLARSFMPAEDQKTIPALNALIVATVAGGLVFLFPSESTLERDLAAARPVAAIASIQPSWRTFNDYSLGGMMDLQAKPTFIDSRNDIFEHHGVLQDYVAIENMQGSFEILNRYRVDHALIPDGGSLSDAFEHSPQWRVLMREDSGSGHYTLFARK